MGPLFGVIVVASLLLWTALSLHAALSRSARRYGYRGAAWLSALTPPLLVAYVYAPAMLRDPDPYAHPVTDDPALLAKDALLLLALLSQTGAVALAWRAGQLASRD
ncbi:MAG: hypothetical protein KC486_04605 [Myxococcales bacterium]|nr:hypothetical protein [Myxococcales bacterium]